jgi:hypothetical protein
VESDQSLFYRREGIEIFRVSMFTSNVHVIDPAGLRQPSVFQAGAALEAHINFDAGLRWKALSTLLESSGGVH